MDTGLAPGVGEVLPADAWEILKSQPGARLIDVRTQAEWSFVGKPDISELGQSVILAEWARFPDMSINPDFADDLMEKLDEGASGPLLFICRSGVRSLRAAEAVAVRAPAGGARLTCLNVAEGFEGDLDADGHRGRVNGWKFRGLPWRQS